jgi:protein involved in polysaccharide export with SLBB domain
MVAALLLAGVVAQAQTPTAEQMAIFQNLPPEQQRAILEQMQRGSTGTQSTTTTTAPLQFPESVLPRDVRTPVLMPSDGIPRIAAGDSIVVDIQVRKYPRTLSPEQPVTPLPVVKPDPTQPAPVPGAMPTPSTSPSPTLEPPEPIERTTEEQASLDLYVARVQRGNPYRLDAIGRLALPELAPIPLAGLTAEEAAKRLDSDPAMRDFELRVTLLPLEPIDVDALQPFGYDLFAGSPTTFAPATDVPVPAEYVLGPGDTLQVQLLGKVSATYSLIVSRDGTIDFPQLGPIRVAGMRFPEAQALIEQRVNAELIGVRSSVSMGPLRSIRVFVLGDAERPGSYTVSGLSTITNALFVSGGVKTIGSLRRIELKRGGRTVRTLDLYDLLLKGDTRADERLQPGDAIFIPSIGQTVTVAGEVNRPAIYELKGNATAGEVIALAGGPTPRADPRRATVERINSASNLRTVVNVDLLGGGRSTTLTNGDLMRVPAVTPTYSDSVWIRGHAFRTGPVQYRPGLRLTDVIRSVEELRPNADLHYVLIRREEPRSRRISVISADLLAALANPASTANVPLASRDEIYVFDAEGPRNRVILPLIDELRLQSDPARPTPVVGIGGSIKAPGQYPLEAG